MEPRLHRSSPSTKTILFLFIGTLTLSSASQQYTVYRAEPGDQHGLKVLNALRSMDHQIDIDFWKEAHRLGDHADIMISDTFRGFFEDKLRRYNISYNVTVPDVEMLIMRNEHKNGLPGLGGKRLNDDPMLDSPPGDADLLSNLKHAKYPFGDYAQYTEMVKYMRAIEFYYPTLTKLVRIGVTHEGRPIEGLKIGFPIGDTNKPAVFIDGNIHAREWASSHTALVIINEMVANYGVDPEVTRQINEANFFIIPCLNPDGYEFTRSSPTPAVRLWRKNRSPERCSRSAWGGERCCGGVDLNRNFDFHWAETGSSVEPCSNIYAGSSAFSEPETQAVEDFFRSKEMRGKIGVYMTLHTYGQLFIHPFSHATNMYPRDIEKLRVTAMKATSRLAQKFGTQYQVGTGADILSPASGGSDDWAKDQMKIKYVFLMELRPREQMSNGFILHKRELIPTGIETYEAVKEVVNSMLIDYHNKKAMKAYERQREISRQSHARMTSPSTTTSIATTTTTTLPTTTTTTTRMPSTLSSTTKRPTTTTTVTRTEPTTTPSTTTIIIKELPQSLVPARKRPWLTYRPKQKRITTLPSTSTTTSTPLSTTTVRPTTTTTRRPTTTTRKPTTTTRKPTATTVQTTTKRHSTSSVSTPIVTHPSLTSTALWQSPSSSFFDDWWSMKRHTKRPPSSPPVFSTIFTTHPELRSSLTDESFLRTHNRVSTLHIERGSSKIPVAVPEPSRVMSKVIDNAVPYSADCKDMRLSCEFWVQNAPGACTEQSAFMKVQCALTCRFCTNIAPTFVDQIEDFRTMRQ